MSTPDDRSLGPIICRRLLLQAAEQFVCLGKIRVQSLSKPTLNRGNTAQADLRAQAQELSSMISNTEEILDFKVSYWSQGDPSGKAEPMLEALRERLTDTHALVELLQAPLKPQSVGERLKAVRELLKEQVSKADSTASDLRALLQDAVRELNHGRPDNGKVRIFIGSSTSALPLAETVRDEINGRAPDVVECVVWNQKEVRALGRTIAEILDRAVHDFDCGLFIFAPDDWRVRGAGSHGAQRGVLARFLSWFKSWRRLPLGESVPRDNLLYEAGLFAGRYSRDYLYILSPSSVKMPSDFESIQTVRYPDTTNPSLSDQSAQLLTALNEIWSDLGKKFPDRIDPA